MSGIRVRDIMTVHVKTVAPATAVRDVARLLLEAGISGVPVVDDERVVGIVSESDLLPVHEGTPPRPVRVAEDVMTVEPITLTEEMTVTEAARVLQRRHVKRAPVLRNGRLVGLVTRSDLLRPYLRTDSEIRADVEETIVGEALGLSPRKVLVSVDAGIVTLRGSVGDERERALLVGMVRQLDGVVDVVAELDGRGNGKRPTAAGSGRTDGPERR